MNTKKAITSSPRFEVVPASAEHIAAIAPNVASTDAAQLKTSCGDDPESALRKSFEISTLCWSVLIEGVPVAMFGMAVSKDDKRIGCPWLIGTPALKRIRRDVLTLAPQYVRQMHAVCPALMNAIAEDNLDAHRFVERCGFRLGIVVENWGVAQVPFILFGSVRRV